MGAEVPAQIRRSRQRPDHPITCELVYQVLFQDFTNSAVRGFRSETGQRDVVSRPGVSSEHPQNITMPMVLE